MATRTGRKVRSTRGGPARARRRGRADGGAPFPADFLWGAATAAYQIEGAAAEDGKGPSIWDTFAHRPGAVHHGHTGDVACDHYHRCGEDVALMRRLGIRAYRFSVSWPRVLPAGVGRPNEAGLAFYDRLVDALLRAGITPLCTLYHWDLPEALQARGGWRAREVADWFGAYAALVARRLGDRVRWWATLNEPAVFTSHGHGDGTHAPGERRPLREQLLVAHNALRAHGKAVQALRAGVPRARLGIALSTDVARPATDRPADVAAARRVMFQPRAPSTWANAWWIDPVIHGAYPASCLEAARPDLPAGFEADLAEVRQPLDFLGLNVYSAATWREGAGGEPQEVAPRPGYPRSGVDWQPIVPSALYWGPRLFHEHTGLPIVITESGLSTRDWVFLDGKVHDPHRVDYLRRLLLEVARARRDGVPVDGYFHWSLLDNFEWAEGYKQRFGLVYVDYHTLRRIPKDSYDFYRRVIATRGRALLGRTRVPVDQVVDAAADGG